MLQDQLQTAALAGMTTPPNATAFCILWETDKQVKIFNLRFTVVKVHPNDRKFDNMMRWSIPAWTEVHISLWYWFSDWKLSADVILQIRSAALQVGNIYPSEIWTSYLYTDDQKWAWWGYIPSMISVFWLRNCGLASANNGLEDCRTVVKNNSHDFTTLFLDFPSENRERSPSNFFI